MSQFNSAVYDDVVVVIISNIDRAISFTGTVDPLKGTASAEVGNAQFPPRAFLIIGTGWLPLQSIAKVIMQPWSFILSTTHVRQFRLCLLVLNAQSNEMLRRTKTEMSPEV